MARASVFDNQEKQAIVRRILVGAREAGCHEVAYLDDGHGIVRTALDDVREPFVRKPVATTETANALDTINAARALRAEGCDVVLTLGGDGTNRAFALGWPDAPLIPISTGTNNVFPVLVEATVAGAAAGLIASGQIALADVARQHKAIDVAIEGERDDLALIDAVLSSERFVGARALLAPETLQTALVTRADPAAVGMTSIGGLVQPLADADDGGLLVQLGGADGSVVNAPIAPGYYRHVQVSEVRRVAFAETVEVSGPGVLAFDGERERALKPGQRATMSIHRSGPWVVDVAKTLMLAAEKGCFRR